MSKLWIGAVLAWALAAAPTTALAQKRYDAGASDQEILIGQTAPYSGPLSAYSMLGKVEAAYFKSLNDQGGINGRKIDLVSLDDAYTPSKTVELTRRLVEQDNVLFIFQTVGTPSNVAIQKYLNAKKIPQLFIATGASRWNDPGGHPWTMAWQPNYRTEARIYARYILEHIANAKIAVLYQNDDYGKDFLDGFRDGLGKRRSMIVSEASYETSDPTVDAQVVQLQSSGADVLFIVASPKFAAQAIRKAAEIGWHPFRFLNSVSASVHNVMLSAGVENSKGIVSINYLKNAGDPQWANDPAMLQWRRFMQRYAPDIDTSDQMAIIGYSAAQTLEQVLRQCGDDLTRENVMRQAARLHDLQLGLLLPGIRINTSPTNFAPVNSVQLARFDGERWEPFGSVLGQ